MLGTTVTDYTYNRNGLRVTETTTTDGGTPVVKSFLFDPSNPTGFAQVLEEYVDGVLDQVFTLGHDVIAQADVSDPQAPDAYTLLSDGHGSTRALIDELNAIIQQFAYDAYGNMLAGTNLTTAATALTTLLYSGEWTQQNGSQYLRARFYDPASGRFNRLDPFIGNQNDPQSLHKYLYAHANPVAFSDPSGQSIFNAFLFNQALGYSSLALSGYELLRAAQSGDPVRIAHALFWFTVDYVTLGLPFGGGGGGGGGVAAVAVGLGVRNAIHGASIFASIGAIFAYGGGGGGGGGFGNPLDNLRNLFAKGPTSGRGGGSSGPSNPSGTSRGDVPSRAADPKAVVNALSGWRSRRFFINGFNLLLDRKGLKHILERHHPAYWNGTIKSTQSFFPRNMSIQQIESTIAEVLRQNPERVAQIGTNRMGTMEGVVDGVRYQLGLNRGRVGQFFPILEDAQ